MKKNTFNIKITLCEKESNVKKNQKKEKTFTQNIADIISDYEQMLVDWDAKLISDTEMEKKTTNFQLKARDMMINMLDEFKTINNILNQLKKDIGYARILTLYGKNEKIFNILDNVMKDIDYINNKIEFEKKEPVMPFFKKEEEIETLDLEKELDYKNCKNCNNCELNENNINKENIERTVSFIERLFD